MRLKRPIAIAQQNGNGIGARVGNREINLAVPIKIAGRNGKRAAADCIVHMRLEGSVALAKENRNCVGA